MSEWEVQLVLEAIKIAIFIGQLILLFVVVDRLRTVSAGLEETRQALVDLRRTLRRPEAQAKIGKITGEGLE